MINSKESFDVKDNRILWLNELAIHEKNLDHIEGKLKTIREHHYETIKNIEAVDLLFNTVERLKIVLLNLRYNIKMNQYRMTGFMKKYPAMLDKVHYANENELTKERIRLGNNVELLKRNFEVFIKDNDKSISESQNLIKYNFLILKIKNYAFELGLRRSSLLYPFQLFQTNSK